MRSAGAGAGVYNTTRQIGAVLGSAAIAALMENRLGAQLPGMSGNGIGMEGAGAALPPQVADGFARAMAQSVVLPAAILLVGVVAALLFERPGHQD